MAESNEVLLEWLMDKSEYRRIQGDNFNGFTCFTVELDSKVLPYLASGKTLWEAIADAKGVNDV